MVGEISASQVSIASSSYKKVESSDTKTITTAATATSSSAVKDTVTLNTSPDKAVTYSSPLSDQQRLDSKFLMLRGLVANLFTSQGLTGPTDASGKATSSTTIDVGDGKTADISTMTPEEATQLVGKDGYWGVDKTSDRIFQQAVGISGNDPTRIDKIKEGILKGFDMAKKALGGTLPDISQQTLDAVMKKLDDWTSNPTQQSTLGQAATVPV